MNILVAVVAAGLALSSCDATPARPSNKQIVKDLSNQDIFIKVDWGSMTGTRVNTGENVRFVGDPEVLTDSAAGTAEVVVNAEIPLGQKLLTGPVLLKYRKTDQGWRVQEMRARDAVHGASYAFEERPLG